MSLPAWAMAPDMGEINPILMGVWARAAAGARARVAQISRSPSFAMRIGRPHSTLITTAASSDAEWDRSLGAPFHFGCGEARCTHDDRAIFSSAVTTTDRSSG